ncbi:unnamed protein product, partial [Hymenolepis diminuta]|uniref:Uncharacterized protein n=1 Tax=Hymenolepis diminuta TaxID=6216 RepID=A0A0R3SD99_HYMDI
MRRDLMWIFIVTFLITSIAVESYLKERVRPEDHLDLELNKLDKSRDGLGSRNKAHRERLNKFHVPDDIERNQIEIKTEPGIFTDVEKQTEQDGIAKIGKYQEKDDKDIKEDNTDNKREENDDDTDEKGEEVEKEKEEEQETVQIHTAAVATPIVTSGSEQPEEEKNPTHTQKNEEKKEKENKKKEEEAIQFATTAGTITNNKSGSGQAKEKITPNPNQKNEEKKEKEGKEEEAVESATTAGALPIVPIEGEK